MAQDIILSSMTRPHPSARRVHRSRLKTSRLKVVGKRYPEPMIPDGCKTTLFGPTGVLPNSVAGVMPRRKGNYAAPS